MGSGFAVTSMRYWMGFLPMNSEEFLSLVWRLEELLMQRDHLQNQIGNCGEGCDDEDEGLCPACCEAFKQVQDEDVRLAKGKELDKVMKKLMQACDEDTTGKYRRILEQSREGKVVH